MMATRMLLGLLLMATTYSFTQAKLQDDDSPGPDEVHHAPTRQDLARAVSRGLVGLARSAHLPLPRLGLSTPLDPLQASSTLKYVHEGDLLRLRLVLDNVTLQGIKSLTVQEVTFGRDPDNLYGAVLHEHDEPRGEYVGEEQYEEEEEEEEDDPEPRRDEVEWYDTYGAHQTKDGLEYDAWYDSDNYDQWSKAIPSGRSTRDNRRHQQEGGGGGGGWSSRDRRPRQPLTAKGVIRVAFKQVTVKAKYQVKGSAGGFFTFRESGDLTLTAPTVFLTSTVNVTLPGFAVLPQRRVIPSRHGRVKVLWVATEVNIASTRLTLRPHTYPPEWVRQQVQSKLEELCSDLSQGHGAVRLLLRRWAKILKRIIHRTARALIK